MKNERVKEDLERRISLIDVFEILRDRLSAWGEDRRITQRSQERKKEDINKNRPTI